MGRDIILECYSGVSPGARDQKGKSRQIRVYCQNGAFLADERSDVKCAHKTPRPDYRQGLRKQKQKNPSSSDCDLYLGRGSEEEEGRTG